MPDVLLSIGAPPTLSVQAVVDTDIDGTVILRIEIEPCGEATSAQIVSVSAQLDDPPVDLTQLIEMIDDEIALRLEARWGQGSVRSSRSVKARSTRFTSGLLAISSSIERSLASSRLFRSAQAAITAAISSVRNPTDRSMTAIIACVSALVFLSILALLLLGSASSEVFGAFRQFTTDSEVRNA